jgi:PAS domain S-box-containing protein
MATLQTSNLRSSGVDVIGDIPWGMHFCLFYDTKADLLETLVCYFGAGLQSQEFCLWVVAPPVTKDDALEALRQAIPESDRHLLNGDIEIVSARDVYLPDGKFDLNRTLAGWIETVRRASARGYVGVRLAADTAWLESKHWKDFCEYEESVNGAIANQPFAALCTYPLAACGAEEILDVVRTHQFAVTKRRGSWDIIETAGHKMAKAEIKRLNEELEQRVIERTSQLAAVNEELTREVADRKRIEALLTCEKRTLEMVAKGDPLSHILDSLCRLVEDQADGVLASVLLVDGDRLRHGGAPSLPEVYVQAIDGAAIGPSAGSCGTAAHRGKQVIVEDIATDPLWAAYRELALPHSLRACWSTPIFSSQHTVIATFAMYYREPRRPNPGDQELIEQITHLAGVAIERKLAQDALRSSEAYLTQAQRLVHLGTWVWKVEDREAVYLSDEWYHIYGFSPEEGAPSWERRLERIHPEDRATWQDAIERAIRDETDYEVDFRILLPTGTVKYLHTIGHAVHNESGGSVRFIGISMDVTEHKRIEQTLRQSEAYLAEAQRLTHTGSWALHAGSFAVVHWSEETFRIFGFDPQKGIPPREQFWERVHPDDRARGQALLAKAVREAQDFTDNFRIVLPDQAVRHIHVSGHPVLNANGDVIEVFGTHVDVTEKKWAERERERLHQLEADLAHMNRISMLGELVASLSHELKQPITAAITNAKTCMRWLARDEPDLQQARDAVTRVVQDSNRATEVINHLRSLYTKGAPAERELVDVNELIGEMVALLGNEANRNAISLRSALAAELPKVTADRVQLQQVFMNLMLNGIESMEDTSGELTVTSQLTGDCQLLFSVSDTGVGLPPEKTDRIFDAFFTTKPQGSGMGLAISRSIVESHGGRIWATANSRRGTVFSFTLPAQAAQLDYSSRIA